MKSLKAAWIETDTQLHLLESIENNSLQSISAADSSSISAESDLHKSQLNKCKEEVESLKNQINDSINSINNLQIEISDNNSLNSELKSELNSLESKYNSLIKQYNLTRLSAEKEKNALLLQENSSLNEKINIANDSLQNLQSKSISDASAAATVQAASSKEASYYASMNRILSSLQ